MCVKKHVEVDPQNNIYGYIDLSAGSLNDLPLARNTIAFLVVGLNDY